MARDSVAATDGTVAHNDRAEWSTAVGTHFFKRKSDCALHFDDWIPVAYRLSELVLVASRACVVAGDGRS